MDTLLKNDSIEYRNLSKPYFKKYFYKISLVRKGLSRKGIATESLEKYLNKITNFYSSDFRCITGNICINVFLKKQEDLDKVINKYRNTKYIRYVEKPVNKEEQEKIQSDYFDTIVQKKLYFGKYRWSVLFHKQYCNRYIPSCNSSFSTKNRGNVEIDQIIKSLFVHTNNEETPFVLGERQDRYWYRYNFERKLFLQEESDVMMVKLALSDKIKKIEKVYTEEEVNAI